MGGGGAYHISEHLKIKALEPLLALRLVVFYLAESVKLKNFYKSILTKKQAFPDSTEDSTGKYQFTYFQVISLTVFVQVVSPLLDWSPLSSFLVIWSPSGDTRGPSVVFEAVEYCLRDRFHLEIYLI